MWTTHLQLRAIGGAENNRTIREQIFPILHQKLGRGASKGDDDVDLSSGVLLPQELPHQHKVGSARESAAVHELGVVVDVGSGRRLECTLKTRIERDIQRRIAVK